LVLTYLPDQFQRDRGGVVALGFQSNQPEMVKPYRIFAITSMPKRMLPLHLPGRVRKDRGWAGEGHNLDNPKSVFFPGSPADPLKAFSRFKVRKGNSGREGRIFTAKVPACIQKI
jgi:hypothetical protein